MLYVLLYILLLIFMFRHNLIGIYNLVSSLLLFVLFCFALLCFSFFFFFSRFQFPLSFRISFPTTTDHQPSPSSLSFPLLPYPSIHQSFLPSCLLFSFFFTFPTLTFSHLLYLYPLLMHMLYTLYPLFSPDSLFRLLPSFTLRLLSTSLPIIIIHPCLPPFPLLSLANAFSCPPPLRRLRLPLIHESTPTSH